MATNPLADSMRKIRDSGAPDIQLSTDARNNYVDAIETLYGKLHDELRKMTPLATLGNVGTFASANQTKANLIDNVTGLDGIVKTITRYLEYLDELKTTVEKACDRMLDAG